MTFRHRHCRRGRLIETAEVEQRKVEAGARKKETCEEEERAIRRDGCPLSRLLWVACVFARYEDHVFPALAPTLGQASEKVGG
jgi:hypothetical protein